MRTLLLPIALLAPAIALAQQQPVNEPVEQLDLERYAGTWHEIAHLPTSFQQDCAGDVTATYTPRDDGRLDVVNQCRTFAGRTKSADGVARQAGGPDGALEVAFAPRWLRWLPFTWADYWVIELDEDYQWAVVGGPDRENLWILSREPSMSTSRYTDLKWRARARGYPVDDLRVMAPID